jgi:predicted transposase/invertase (TIGR01784 family)
LDFIFKAIFTSGTSESQFTLKQFLSAVLGQEITDVAVIQNEPAVDGEQDKQIRYDIACRFNDGELANVEMNLSSNGCDPARLEYYTSRLLLTQEAKGDPYKELKNTYQISLMVSGNLCEDDSFLHCFRYYDEEAKISLNGITRIVTMELSKLKEKPPGERSRVESWALWFKYVGNPGKREMINELIEEEEGLKMATKTLVSISKDQEAKIRAMWKEKAELDYYNDITISKQEGIEKGRQEGIAQGRQEGSEKKAIEVARNFLEMGLDVKQIAQATGLSVEQINSL